MTNTKTTAKKKDPNKSKAAMAKKKNDVKEKIKGDYTNPGSMMRDLLIEQKYTDDEIFEKVSKAFPEKTVKQTYCNNWRHNLNKMSGSKEFAKNPIERLFKIDGKLVKKSVMPKKAKSPSKKYTEDNDPLKKIAGINVHKKKAAVKNDAPKKDVSKKAPTQKKVVKKSEIKRTLK